MNAADLRSPFAADIARSLSIDPPAAPLQPAEPGIWSGLGGALRDFAPAALGETGRTVYRAVTANADDVMRRQQQEVDDFTAEAILRRRVELDAERQQSDVAMRDFVRRFTPDPATTGVGAQVVFGLGKTLTKAIPSILLAGPLGGAALTGGLEGGAEMQRLEDQGVDTTTAGRAGLATGVLTAVGFGLPAAGTTLARTAGLVAVGGPGGFMAQQAATRYILDSADYTQTAQQYDPFDPIGLAVSTLAAGAFGAAAMAGRSRAGGARLPEDAEPAARAVALSEQAASTGLHAPADLDGAAKHLDALAAAARQMEQGKPVDVADRVTVDPDAVAARTLPDALREDLAASVRGIEARADVPEVTRAGLVERYQRAAAVKPEFDTAVREVADSLGLTHAPKIPDQLKGIDRAIEKTMADYKGDPSRLRDLVRATVVIDDIGQVQRAIDALGARFGEFSKLRNTLTPDSQPTSPDGYRDVLINATIKGETVEIQVSTPELMRAKAQAHKLYEVVRRIQGDLVKEDRDPTPAEAATIRALETQQRAIYQAAWTEATSARNAASSSSSPLRRKESTGKRRGSAESQARQAYSAVQETGTPSTSANRVPAGNDAGSDMVATSEAIVRAPAGAMAEVTTERGLTLPFRYKVVDAGDLITSHDDGLRVNPDFPPELQPRDRTRAASEAQIARIEARIDPELLAESRKAADGAPVIGADGVVESGNARTIALRRAYGGGKAEGYRTWLVDNAARFGLRPADVEGIRRPVLVRETQGAYNRAEFARQANEAAQARMSAPEQAKVDAQRMPDLDRLVTNEDGTINVPQSREFIRDFFDSVVSPSELNDMLAGDGRPSAAGLARIRNALFAKAYGDAELVAMLTESTDANIRNILAGLMRAAPSVAKLRDQIAAGARQPVDFAGDLATAARQFSRLRAEGTSVEQFLGQGALIDSPITPEVAAILRGLADNARSAPRIADMLQRMIGAVDALGDPRQGGMFDAPTAGVRDVAEAATGAMRQQQQAAATAQQSIELQAAREVLAARPDLRLAVAEGESLPAAQVLEQAAADAAADRADAAAYQAAVACFLRG